MASSTVSPASFGLWPNHRPWVVVGDWGCLDWASLLGLPSFDFGLHKLELLFNVEDDLHQIELGLGVGRVDCVSAHALLGISKYPRDTIGSRSAH